MRDLFRNWREKRQENSIDTWQEPAFSIELLEQRLLLSGNGFDFPGEVPPSYTVGDEPLSMTSGDFDGDGDVDLATANSGNSTVSVLLNLGDGTFAAQVTQFDNDGFTVDVPTYNVDRTNFHYLALKGGQYKIGTLFKPGAAGPQIYGGVGFPPHGLAFFSRNMGANWPSTGSVSGRISFSAADTRNLPAPPNQAATFFARTA